MPLWPCLPFDLSAPVPLLFLKCPRPAPTPGPLHRFPCARTVFPWVSLPPFRLCSNAIFSGRTFLTVIFSLPSPTPLAFPIHLLHVLFLHLAFKPWSILWYIIHLFSSPLECKLHSSRACFFIFLVFFPLLFQYLCLINICGMNGWISLRPESPESRHKAGSAALHGSPTQHSLSPSVPDFSPFGKSEVHTSLSFHIFTNTFTCSLQSQGKFCQFSWGAERVERVQMLFRDWLYCGNCRFFFFFRVCVSGVVS